MTLADRTVTVLLVDDHAVVREGYRRLLERAEGLVVVGEASSAAEAYQAFCATAPDVVVMDISLGDASGIEAMRRLLQRDAQARVLIFSIHDEPIFADRAFKAGARGYVTKSSAPDVLVDAVRAVAAGGIYLGTDIAQALALHGLRRDADAIEALSHREFEVLRLLAEGHSIEAVARRLCLHTKTIANYQSEIRRKLGVDSALQMLRVATRSGLVRPSSTP
jgi:DNA-binding NarL/FixJ family response regulator